MYQGTTPAVTYSISGLDVSAMKPFVSFKNGTEVLTKTGDAVVMEYDSVAQVTTVICYLTQTETLAMTPGSTKTQIRFVDADGQAYATEKATLRVDDVIYKSVIVYEEE